MRSTGVVTVSGCWKLAAFLLLSLHSNPSLQQANDNSTDSTDDYYASDAAGDLTSVNGTLGAEWPKDPDIIACSGSYGVEMDPELCQDAIYLLNDLPPGAISWAHMNGPRSGAPVYIVPRVFENNKGKSDRSQAQPHAYPPMYCSSMPKSDRPHPDHPLCVITVDVAGLPTKLGAGSSAISKGVIEKMAKTIRERCILPLGQGGFGTIDLSDAVSGLARGADKETGYDIPSFLTVSMTGPGSYPNPGDFNPEVSTALRAGLVKKSSSMFTTKAAKARIQTAIAALGKTFPQMRVPGTKPWWDFSNYRPYAPPGAGTICRPRAGSPDPQDCRNAYWGLARPGMAPLIKRGQPLIFKSGTCRFEISSNGNPVSTSWENLRAGADTILDECLFNRGAPGTGGDVFRAGLASNGAGNDTQSLKARDDTSNGTVSLGMGNWPLELNLAFKAVFASATCLGSGDNDNGTVCAPGEAGAPSGTAVPSDGASGGIVEEVANLTIGVHPHASPVAVS